jgi:mRNA interferase RelE/StbE
MRHRLILRPSARKDLKKLKVNDYELIIGALHSLQDEPHKGDIKKLANIDLLRLRVRDYRIIYFVDDRQKVVYVERITRRSEGTYRGL